MRSRMLLGRRNGTLMSIMEDYLERDEVEEGYF